MKFIKYLIWKFNLKKRMVEVDETMDLRKASEFYAKYVCKMNHWLVHANGGLTKEFCDVSFAFSNGYVKALHDNGFEFQRGLVKKRDILEYVPHGALEYYRKDTIKETKTAAVKALQKVLEQYETSKQNINTLMIAFKEELEKPLTIVKS